MRSVQVSLSVKTTAGCRFVKATGALTAPMPCDTAGALVAKGTTKWSLATPRLPKGKLSVTVRALDGAGNVAVLSGAPLTVR